MGTASTPTARPIATHRGLRAALLVLCASACFVIAGAAAADEGRVPSVASSGDVAWLIGSLPYRCVEMDGGARYCVWRVRDSAPRWQQVAKLFLMDDRFNLTCAFTNAESVPIHERCQAHRYNTGSHSNSIYGKNASDADKKKMREAAILRIETAASLADLVSIAGDVPSACMAAGADATVCEWHVQGSTPGYPTFAKASNHIGKKIRTLCRFERGAGDWTSDGCQVGLFD